MPMDADAIVQVLLRERLRVTAVAASVVRDIHAADDIFQQVVLTALENRNQFCEAPHVLAWAIRAARHRAIDWARRRRLVCFPDEVLDLLEADWSDTPHDKLSEQLEALHRCLNRLASRAQEMLHMKYVDGLNAAGIAAELQRTPDAIYQSLSRIHRFLRDCVGQELIRSGWARRPEEVVP